jgi:5-deoxy-D-glucuronate isomerase
MSVEYVDNTKKMCEYKEYGGMVIDMKTRTEIVNMAPGESEDGKVLSLLVGKLTTPSEFTSSYTYNRSDEKVPLNPDR